MKPSYELALVLLSVAVAMLASFTALQLASRVLEAPNPRIRRAWLLGGALAMGTGIWSMHFVGMVAMSLPIPLSYEPGLTALSALIAALASGLAMHLMGAPRLSWRRLGGGGLLMGAAIGGMHYTGMAAIPLSPGIRYTPGLVIASLLIAVLASMAAMWIAFALRRHGRAWRAQALAAAVMGAAISGMHYTGMAAAHFAEGSVCGVGLGVGRLPLVVAVSLIAICILSAAIALALLDARLAAQRLLALQLTDENRALSHRAHHDDLTGQPNRRMLEEHLEARLLDLHPDAGSLAVLFLDLDGFKLVNDSAGHRCGDELLRQVARRLAHSIRQYDLVARLSGDEFVVIAADVHLAEQIDTLCHRILEAIRAPYEVEGMRLSVSASIGVARFPQDGRDARALLLHADGAMYEAKRQGRDSYHVGVAQAPPPLVQELVQALQRGEFLLHYQPVVAALNFELRGVAALLRWQHPGRGLVPPGDFIPLAEQHGIIGALGDWILEEACRHLAQWQAAGAPYWMSVNLSVAQLLDLDLPRRVASCLGRHAVAPDRLVLEITETMAMQDCARSEAVLAALRALGVGIAMDDFGTGHSSLSYLHRLPVDKLKVDRSFVETLPWDETAGRIVETIITLAHSMRLGVVAEGVESAAQHEFLQRSGCEELQGFWIARPMPWEALNELITQRLGRLDPHAAPAAPRSAHGPELQAAPS